MSRFRAIFLKISLLALASGIAHSAAIVVETDDSYLVIKASVSNTDMQPYWICLSKALRCKHISASDGFVKIKPGKYELHHVDFTKSMNSGDTDRDALTNKKPRSGGGAQFFVKSIKLNVEPELIYFVGDLVLTQKKSRKYKIDLKQDTSMIIEACQKHPSIFEKYGVTDIYNKKTMMVSC